MKILHTKDFEAIGVTRRQLHYWIHAGLIEPGRSVGGHYRYGAEECWRVVAIVALRGHGITFQRIRSTPWLVEIVVAGLKRQEEAVTSEPTLATHPDTPKETARCSP